jgi:2-polyprenyl-3-methyl-5-hydroxy-6-metoxy-1,4-benzoquinol methylase
MNTTAESQLAESRTNTAYLDWDVRWQSEEGRADWIEPESFVIETIPFLKERNVSKVVDLGCGVGRHAILLAAQGFSVTAVDASVSAVNYVVDLAQEHDLTISIEQSEMTDLPFKTDSIDYLLAWNVIYHGDQSVVTRSVSEILRVLKPGGLFQGTMLSKRNEEIASGRRISRNTYINTDRFEKRHPHFYCDGAELVALFNGFEPVRMMDETHKRPGSFHWHVLMEKK